MPFQLFGANFSKPHRGLCCIYTIWERAEVSGATPWRAEQRNDIPFISAVDAEVAFVDSDYQVARIKLTHSNDAETSQIRMPILIS